MINKKAPDIKAKSLNRSEGTCDSFSGFEWRGSSRQIVEVSVADALILPGAQLTVK